MIDKNGIEETQKKLCDIYNVEYCPSQDDLKVGIALNVKNGFKPLNGLRHPPEGDTTGWYIWAGEKLSDDPGFFKPLHVKHLIDWCPEVLKFIGLPPGWRFLTTNGYEDVWYDEDLLDI